MELSYDFDLTDILNNLEMLGNELEDLTQVFYDIGIVLMRSVDKNFIEQGRPEKWKQSISAMNRNGQTLMDTGRLRSSLIIEGSPESIFIYGKDQLTYGTEVPYAVDLVPTWEFLLVQKEDEEMISDIFIRQIEKVFDN